MAHLQPPIDAELLAAFKVGDTDVFAGIYDRYADPIFSYALTALRSPDQAASATRDTFLAAAAGLEDLSEPSRFRPWLFAIVRHQTRSHGRHRVPLAPREELVYQLTNTPGIDAAQADLLVQVWEAMDVLGDRDQDLVALHLSEGLTGYELAEAMSVEMAYLDDLVDRMEGRVQRALGPLLISRLGVGECDDLKDVVGDWEGDFTPDVRSRVARHIGMCEACQKERTVLMGPGEVLPGIMSVAAPQSLRQRVLDDVDALMTAPDEEPASTVGLPPSTPASVGTLTRTPGRADLPARDPGLNEKAMLGLFAVVTAVVGLIGLAVSAQIDPVDLAAVTGSGDRAAAPVNTTTTSLPTSTANPESSGSDQTAPPTGPGVIEVSANAIDFGDDETNAQFEITNTGGQPVEFTVTSSVDTVVLSAGGGELGAGESVTYDVLLDRENMVEGEMNESIRVAWEGEPVVIAVTASQIDDPILHAPQADPSTVQVKGCGNTTTKVSVRVRDRSPLASVVVRWSPDGGDTTETPMSEVGGDFFEATIGPFTTVHTAAVKIVATDEMGYAGGATISVEVTACQ